MDNRTEARRLTVDYEIHLKHCGLDDIKRLTEETEEFFDELRKKRPFINKNVRVLFSEV